MLKSAHGLVDGLVPDSNGPGDTWTELQAGSSIAAASRPEMNIPDIEHLEALYLVALALRGKMARVLGLQPA